MNIRTMEAIEAIEELHLDVESALYKASELQIMSIVDTLEVTDDLSNKSKRQKLVFIRKSIESKLDEDGDLEAKSNLLENILAIINDTPPPLEVNNTPAQLELLELQKQQEALKKKQEDEMNQLLSKLEELKKSSGLESDKEKSKEKNNGSGVGVEFVAANSVLRREFKIAGQIGEPDQTDKLSFVSLTHQIDSALKRGYDEIEIVDAIIRSISPHSSLRSYVETLHDLSLAKLRKILRVHYREKTASALYQLLATACQTPKETAQQFLLRSLDLRNKVIFASQEADCEVSYE